MCVNINNNNNNLHSTTEDIPSLPKYEYIYSTLNIFTMLSSGTDPRVSLCGEPLQSLGDNFTPTVTDKLLQ